VAHETKGGQASSEMIIVAIKQAVGIGESRPAR
jgi:hypothetical protein